MQKQSLLELLYSKHRLGIKPGLERTLQLAEFVNNPQRSYDTLHIAGTNGKGTTCSVISSLLTEKGLTVGLYTSPHIKDFNERIRVNGEPISDYELIEHSERLLPFAEKIEATFFEITTIIAFMHFRMKNVDVAIIETGMGGRYDSTNIITPSLSIITDIDMDHEEFLGDTIEKIAFEKAGIIKPNIPYMTSNTDTNIRKVIEAKASETNSNEIEIVQSIDQIVAEKISTQYISKSFALNYRTALSAAEYYLSDRISTETQIQAIEKLPQNAGYFARLQIVNNSPIFIVDISHSVAAARNLVESVASHYCEINKWDIIFTVMDDKDCLGILSEIRVLCDKLIITETPNSRNMNVEQIAIYAEQLELQYEVNDNPRVAYEKQIERGKNTIVTGSFYLAAEIL